MCLLEILKLHMGLAFLFGQCFSRKLIFAVMLNDLQNPSQNPSVKFPLATALFICSYSRIISAEQTHG